MDYKNGKMYMIYACVDGADEVYIGSTTQTLSKRMSGHRSSYNHKYISSSILFDKYGIEHCKIELICNFPCETKDELNREEGRYIRERECVNKNVAGQTYKEWIQTDEGVKSDLKRRIKYRLSGKHKIASDKYEPSRRLTMDCPLCSSHFQKREWYTHITGKYHLSMEKENGIQLCKCGHQIDDAHHENTEHHCLWLKQGIKSIDVS